ncbi:MAG: hypothetical protein ACYC5W_13190 [Thauera sp.]
MRSIQVVMLTLCLLGGLYLLTQAPTFFMPARGNPALAYHFSPEAARLLGGALIAMAAAGMLYMRAMYYREHRQLPGPREQRGYFLLLVIAFGLFAAALVIAEPGANPEYRPPLDTR